LTSSEAFKPFITWGIINSLRCKVKAVGCMKSHVIVEGIIRDDPSVVRKKLCGEKDRLIK